jgi:hypothetical protein
MRGIPAAQHDPESHQVRCRGEQREQERGREPLHPPPPKQHRGEDCQREQCEQESVEEPDEDPLGDASVDLIADLVRPPPWDGRRRDEHADDDGDDDRGDDH